MEKQYFREENQPKKGPLILVVDDDKAVLDITGEFLSIGGFEVIKAEDGQKALNIIHANPSKIDLILSDVRMPEMNGLELLSHAKDIPTILVTGSDFQSQQEALQGGAIDFLQKPYDFNFLSLRIRNLLTIFLKQQEIINHLNSTNAESQEQIAILMIKLAKLKETHLKTEKEFCSTSAKLLNDLTEFSQIKDPETGEHIERMRNYSFLIANELQCSEEFCNLIFTASKAHDIGKMMLKKEILHKPGKLTPEEFDHVKTHTVLGANIYEGLADPIYKMAYEISLKHHERWDGKGYPSQLKGEEIPLAARIVAVADVFDALTSERPYKKAWSIQEAFDYIEKEKGSHFDPDVVEAFFAIQDKIIAIKEKITDKPTEIVN